MSKNSGDIDKKPEEMNWSELIRLRPGMYIGNVDIRGFASILKGVCSPNLSNIPNCGVSLQLTGKVSGILRLERITNPIDCIWSGFYQHSENPYGYEFQPLNALSECFDISLFDNENKLITRQVYEKGELKLGEKINEINCANLEVRFKLDEAIWGAEFALNGIYLSTKVQELAYLNKGVKYEMKYQTAGEGCRVVFCFKDGLQDKLKYDKLSGIGGVYFDTYFDEKIEDFRLELAFAFREYTVDEANIISYVNDFYTHQNGTHVDGVLKGLTLGIKKYLQKNDLANQYKITRKEIKKSLILHLNITLENPFFKGSTKSLLGNPEIVKPISEYVAKLFFTKLEANKEATQKLINRFRIRYKPHPNK